MFVFLSNIEIISLKLQAFLVNYNKLKLFPFTPKLFHCIIVECFNLTATVILGEPLFLNL